MTKRGSKKEGKKIKGHLCRKKAGMSLVSDAGADGVFGKKKSVQHYELPQANLNNNCEAEPLTLP